MAPPGAGSGISRPMEARFAMRLREAWNDVFQRVGFPGHLVIVEGELGPSGRIVAMYRGPGQPEIGSDERPGSDRWCIVGYVPTVDAPAGVNGKSRIPITIWGVGSTWEEAIVSACGSTNRTLRVALTLTFIPEMASTTRRHRDREPYR